MQRIQKTIAEFVIPAIRSGDTVTKAIRLMKNRGSDCALVVDGGKLVGIFTERDFLYRVIAEQRLPSETRVGEVMTPDPETLKSGDSIAYAINRMVLRGFRNIPIVDDAGHPISVLNIRHVMEHMNEVFAELDTTLTSDVDEWTDIGGG